MKKIGILGASGTIGYLVCKLLQERYEIIGGCRKNNENLKNLKNFTWQKADLYDNESIKEFCRKSDVVVNCAGPAGSIKDRVALVAQKEKKPYIDASDFIIVEEECIGRISEESVCVAGAGYVPGLGGMLVKWAFKTLFDKLDKVVCYQGGKQHFSVNAFTDIILGAVSGVGHGDSYYRNGRILKENNMNHTQTTFPGMDTPVYMKSYLSEEMIKAAKECEVKELHWMNSVSDEKMMSMIMDAFQLIITNERENAIEKIRKMAEEYIASEDDGEKEWYSVIMECRGKKDGERKEYTITFTVDKEEEASSLVAAAVVDAVIKHSPVGGLYWAFEVMEVEDIANMLEMLPAGCFCIEEKKKDSRKEIS